MKTSTVFSQTWSACKMKYELSGYLFIAPFYATFIYFVVIPVINGFINSFTNYDLYKTKDFVGLKNFYDLLTDEIFLTSIVNTAKYAVLYIVPTMAIGLLVALALDRPFKGFNLLRVGFYIPNVISMVAASMIWLWIFEPSVGILNQILRLLGQEPRQWLRDPNLAMYCMVAISIWKSLGYCMIIYLAGLKSIPAYLYEAAMIDGAGGLHKFFHITLPLLQPTLFFLFVTSCIASFNVFEQVNVLTNGGPMNTTTTIVHQIYTRAFTEFRMGYASAMAMVLLLIVSLITLGNFKFGNQGADLDIG
jgi:ABC-type sugar transport system permease subunit